MSRKNIPKQDRTLGGMGTDSLLLSHSRKPLSAAVFSLSLFFVHAVIRQFFNRFQVLNL